MTFQLPSALAELVALRHGAFQVHEVFNAGCSRADLRRRLRTSDWVGLRHGVYTEQVNCDRASDPELRHLLDSEALALAVEVPIALSHRTAVLWHDLDHLNFSLHRIHATRERRPRPLVERSVRVDRGIEIHVSGLPTEHVQEFARNIFVTTSPAR